MDLRVVRAIKNPSYVLKAIKRKLRSLIIPKVYVGEVKNRSDSDNGLYIAAVQKAVEDYTSFIGFKKNLDYQTILEHVTRNEGAKYLEIIQQDSPQLIEHIEKYKDNDLIGNPDVFTYPGIGSISPTTLRYIKVASDLTKLFGEHIGKHIVEIGVGYGGQALINDRTFNIKQYTLLDLPPVLNLVSKYFECHILNCAYKISTINQHTDDIKYDLVISNYAFSELPCILQIKYLEKIICKCTKGYMTLNNLNAKNKLTLTQLRNYIPAFEVFQEKPLTAPNNCIIAWGHKDNKLS